MRQSVNSSLKSTSKTQARKKSIPKNPVTFFKFNAPKILLDGEDVSPLPLSSLLYQEGKERQMAVLDMRESSSISAEQTASAFKTLSTHRFKSELFKMGKSTGTVAKSFMEDEETALSIEEKLSEIASFVTSEVLEDDVVLEEKEMPKYLSLILYETDTYYILDIPSSSVAKGTEEADSVLADNELYDHLTIGKGRNRKVVNQEVQTMPMVLKNRDTQKDRMRKKSDHAFVSGWEMFDTYHVEQKKVIDSDESSSSSDDLFEEKEETQSIKTVDSFITTPEEKQMIKLVRNSKFQDAVEVIQRLLANNNFNEQQKRFRGLSDPDPFRENVEFEYRLNLLWTFANEETEGKPVTCMKWNPYNSDILAVGYGKFFFTEKHTGMVMLWNIKNPVQPERSYKFGVGVTALEFSKLNPNLLGVGFYNGYIQVMDVSSRTIRIICQTSKDTFPNFEAVWQINFEVDKNKQKEYIISFGQDGRICKTGPIGVPSMISTQIMRIVKGEGKLKGLETTRKCKNPAVEVCRFPSCFVGCYHPIKKHLYYVGTNEGVFYTCSKHYFHQHLNANLGHDGGVYQMKFSPFCGKLLMTCGDDWHIRIWIEDVDPPVLELRVDMHSVQSADWSPIHSTILASVSGKDIHIWDLQRKTYTSQSSRRSPTNCRNTVINFTEDGRCVVVGDVEGNVHVFSLEDMPFSPFFQANYLTASLRRALVSKPALRHQVMRIGNLDYDMSEVKKMELRSE